MVLSLNLNSTWYECLRDPHGKIATDPEHTAIEDVGGAADDNHTGKSDDEEPCTVFWQIHLHQHCGHQKHQQNHKKRREDSNVWRHPANKHT